MGHPGVGFLGAVGVVGLGGLGGVVGVAGLWGLGDRARGDGPYRRGADGGVVDDGLGDHIDGVEPLGGEKGPVLLGRARRVYAEAVAAGGVHVELGGDALGGQRLEVNGGVLAVAAIVFGLDEEGGRGLVVGGVYGVELRVVGWDDEVGGVDDDGEVGAGVDFGVGVGSGGGGFDVVVVGVGAHEDGEIASGGEADDADARGVDVPGGGVGAGDAHGLLRVFEVGEVFGIVALFRDSVLDQKTGDADGVEPLAGVDAFAIPGEADVGAAGEDERGCSCVLHGRRRQVDRERGFGDVGEPGGAVSADEGVGGLGDVGFGVGGLGGLGCVVRPEGNDGLLRGCGSGGEDESSGEDANVHGEHGKPCEDVAAWGICGGGETHVRESGPFDRLRAGCGHAAWWLCERNAGVLRCAQG
jgi:hypothetical protein